MTDNKTIKKYSTKIIATVFSISIGFLIFVVALLFFIISYPKVEINFEVYSDKIGYNDFYEATIDITNGRPHGISNLSIEFDFPTNISNVEILSNVGCEGLEIKTIKQTNSSQFVTHKNWDNMSERSGRIFIKKALDKAKIVIKFKTTTSSFDNYPISDFGYYEGTFDWEIPIFNKLIPSTSILNLNSILEGKIPEMHFRAPYVPTYGHAASVWPLFKNSSSAYYNINLKKGGIISVLDPRDFNYRLRKKCEIFSISRPSTKIKISTDGAGHIFTYLNWIYCDNPLIYQKKFKKLSKEHIDSLLRNNKKIGVRFQWSLCETSIDLIEI